MDIGISNSNKSLNPKSSVAPHEQEAQSSSTDQSLLTLSTLDAPYFWHADAEETDKENYTSRVGFRVGVGQSDRNTYSTNGAKVETYGKNLPGNGGDEEQTEDEDEEEDSDLVGPIHPVFVVPWGVAEKARKYFEDITGF